MAVALVLLQLLLEVVLRIPLNTESICSCNMSISIAQLVLLYDRCNHKISTISTYPQAQEHHMQLQHILVSLKLALLLEVVLLQIDATIWGTNLGLGLFRGDTDAVN